MNRIASLDGFRAVSIILVVFSHFRFLAGFPEELKDFAKQCDVGVTVFFVISGFLITSLLLEEYKKYNSINIKSFFIKRAFRILPVFLLYILILLCFNNTLKLNITKDNFIHALTFTSNFDYQYNWFLGHFWTLSIEEQFYLIWPFSFLIFKKNLKASILILIAYSCIVRVLVYKFKLDQTVLLHPFFFKADAILIGAYTAILYYEKPVFFTKKLFNNYYMQIIALLSICFFVNASAHGNYAKVSLPFGNTIISIAIMYIILNYMTNKNNLVFKFLNTKFMVHIGVLSYSIYVWQQLFFTDEHLLILRMFPLNIFSIYLISLASYFLWEKPFLNLRNKLLYKQTI